ncbi:MAG: MTH938/NDUFAF3 family protein [candidate division WOR-3 bacterium]
MKIEKTGFGWIIIDGKKYNYDILILANGEILNRYENFSGDNHEFSIEEAQKLLNPKPEVIIIGTGQSGILKVKEETIQFLKEQKVKLIALPTPKAIEVFHKLKDIKACLFHLTC